MAQAHSKRIVLGITGGIAAYKSAELVRLLVQDGISVQVVMTEAATRFVAPATFQALSGRAVYVDLWDPRVDNGMAHIDLSRAAQAILIAPASADFIARLVHGFADDLLSTLCLARECPLLVAPAMNRQMWDNAATQRNVAQLAGDGVAILGPGVGDQACGEVGSGRMLEPVELHEALTTYFLPKPLAGKRILITDGAAASKIRAATELVYGGSDDFAVTGADRLRGSFFAPMLLACATPFTHTEPHDIEAFGPVNTVMPYKTIDEAIELAKLGRGSLCGSLITADTNIARQVVLGVAPFHGRILVLDRNSAKESTGHGSPLPNLIHGGPGRAGGGEEMGGARGVLHYMQRSALQGSPAMITAVTREWVKGGPETTDGVHPFRKFFQELAIGETMITKARTMTHDDVANFAELSGDKFYAHMSDAAAAKEGVFERKVAHGYLVLSAAAGLFVDPAPGPVLANYGLDNLRFIKPVYPGDAIHVRLTCKQKTAKDTPEGGVPQGVVAWDVEVFNQTNEPVAVYTILTLVRLKG